MTRRTPIAWRVREAQREPLRVIEVPGMYQHPKGRFFALQQVHTIPADLEMPAVVMRGHGTSSGPWSWRELSRHEWWCFDAGIKLALRKEFRLARTWKPAR